MITTTLEKNSAKGPRIVFSVPLPNRDPVFMSVSVSDYGKENLGIVIVNAERFLRLWRAESDGLHWNIANGSPQTWPDDSKYGKAIHGFSHGLADPVPLAYVHYESKKRTVTTYKFLCFGRSEHKEKIEYISFTNGITRTIWLLTQGCASFPVQCDIKSAQPLFQSAGADGTSFYALGDLAELLASAEPCRIF